MDNVFVYDNDIVDIVDVNRLSSFPQTYQETFLEALTVGKRTVSINGVNISVLSIAAPTINLVIAAQYFAVEGRVAFQPAVASVPVVHPSPGVAYDFYVYFMLRLDDVTDTRTNVNPGTFVQTPTSRVIAKQEVAEYTVLSVAAGGGAPTPPIGVGVPGAGMERLGYVLRSTFTWDGVAVTFPTVAENTADTVRFGSSGIPPHGGTHVTTDPLPYPTDALRGAGPPRTLPYWKNAISRVEPAAGSPITAVAIGQNGPAGDINYDVYNPATARGFELDFDFEAGSYQIIGTTFTPRFAAPPNGGTSGTALTHARSDHGHLVLSTLPEWRRHDVGTTYTTIQSAPFVDAPAAPQPIAWGGGYAGQIGVLQLEVKRVSNANLRSILTIIGGSGMTRQIEIQATNNAYQDSQSMEFFILLNGSGGITINYQAAPCQYRVAILGVFGQGT